MPTYVTNFEFQNHLLLTNLLYSVYAMLHNGDNDKASSTDQIRNVKFHTIVHVNSGLIPRKRFKHTENGVRETIASKSDE